MNVTQFDFFDVEQNTDEWLSMRAGRLTSSKLGVVMANYGKAFGDPAKKYAVNIAIEQITGQPLPSEYTNADMERGHVQEPIARMLYEEETFCSVGNGGFYCSEFIGCSPDGLVNNDGLVEIKSAIPSIHYGRIKSQKVDSQYKWQCIGNLKFTGRDWLDFISFCSDFPEEKKLYIYRLHKDQLSKEFEMINSRVEEFEKLVKTTKSTILESNYRAA